MSSLPTGTVTFLFTDIEDSTRLWQEYPVAMRQARARHDAILRSAIEAQGGRIFKTVEDACYAVFATPQDALQVAVATQQALYAEPWGETGPLRVRMALHTAVAEAPAVPGAAGDYQGPPLNRVARLLAAGHGSQILMSQPVYDLVRDTMPASLDLRDLGERRLRDLIRPERVFQLVIPGLPADFPALRTLETFPNNLPVQLTSFIGREKEMVEVHRLLSNTHLLTLTGVGGTGKTRLSLQVGADLLDTFSDGVWFVELAPLSDPALVPRAIATALGVREEPDHPLDSSLIDFLRPKHLLLILDNCEHLIAACARWADVLLHACSQVRILASSREALGIAGEVLFHVPSLSLPDPQHLPAIAALTQYEAVRLFIDRALALMPDFAVTNQNAPAVAQVCYRLDGIPLAIELAAARVKMLSVDEIAARLDDRFRLLTGGSRTALPRQQTLHASIDWSYTLLGEAERVLLDRLSVFAGGWTLKAAEAVGADVGQDSGHPRDVVLSNNILDLLAHLVDKCLVVVERDQAAETRYRLLETIRQYARDKLLTSGEGEAVQTRHLEYFLHLAEEAELKLDGPEQVAWRKRLEADYDNLRAALQWAIENNFQAGLQLAGAMGWIWVRLGYFGEGRRWLEEVLAQPGALSRTGARAKALYSQGRIGYLQGDLARARFFLNESISIWRELAASSVLTAPRPGLAAALSYLSLLETYSGNYEQAGVLGSESVTLWREVGEKVGLALSLRFLAHVPVHQGAYAEARQMLEESLALFREAGHTLGLSVAMTGLGHLAESQGDYTDARTWYEQALVLRREVGEISGVALLLDTLGDVTLNQGDYEQARAFLEELLSVAQEIGNRPRTAKALLTLGQVALNQGDYERARAFLEESLSLAQELGNRQRSAKALLTLGQVAVAQGEEQRAASLLLESLSLLREPGYGIDLVVCLAEVAEVARLQGQIRQAVRLCGGADALLKGVQPWTDPYGRPEYERSVAAFHTQMEETVAALRAKMKETVFAAAWAEGQGMTGEEAITYALELATASALQREPKTFHPAQRLTERQAARQQFGGLTPRECQVAALIAQGKSNQAIARELVVGLSTVEAHVSRSLAKLGFSSRAQIAVWAVEKGLVRALRNDKGERTKDG
ncbi:MAG: tetratricopeptide repeat protein [Chloroflexi bacterium]|nr:tetratricopeptide repeat protein [Chloroflexota bacterium]